MSTVSKRRTVPAGPARVWSVLADFGALAVAPRSVDLIWSNLAWHGFVDPLAVVAEWHRVVRPEGLLMLSAFYWLVEIAGFRRLVFPLVVVGMNSITIYVLHSLCAGWIRDGLHKHLPASAFPAEWLPVIDRCGVLLVLWLICWWLYKQKAFLRL